jgi:hypothetical protein
MDRDRGLTRGCEPAHSAGSLDAPNALFENRVMRRLAPRLSGALIALALAAPAAARPRDPLYQWTDAAGAVRYTTEVARIPADRRSAAVLVAAAHPVPPRAEQPTTGSAAQPTGAPPPGPAAPAESAPSAAGDAAGLDAQIAELEKSIAADEAALADYISDPDRAKKEGSSADVSAISERLPALQKELGELKKQREAATGAAAPHAP